MFQTANPLKSAFFETQVVSEARGLDLNNGTFAGNKDGHVAAVINRLLTAAVINRTFRQRLLKNPRAAISDGYHDERFAFSASEIGAIGSIQATTLPEFSRLLSELMQINYPDV